MLTQIDISSQSQWARAIQVAFTHTILEVGPTTSFTSSIALLSFETRLLVLELK